MKIFRPIAIILSLGFFVFILTACQTAKVKEELMAGNSNILPKEGKVDEGTDKPAEAPAAETKGEQTKEITIGFLLANLEEYNGQTITVTGRYKKARNRAIPMCEPTGTGKNPVIKEAYRIYPSSWKLTELNDGYKELGIIVTSEKDVQVSALPNYKEGQKITLQGVAKFTTIPDDCLRDIRYKSIYLEVRAKDIDIDLKPVPDSSVLDIN